ncbi:hypothetical protein [Streptomyces atratus]|uniref:hypothetical protein n=1 Tax=Streptomyces atratus TaxID=1893 RepID=UPI003656058E
MNTSTTRMPAAALAVVALLALTGCAKTTASTSTSNIPHCTAVRTTGGDLVTSRPRPCLLTGTPRSTGPATVTPEHQPTAAAPTKAKPAAPAPIAKDPLRKNPAPAAKVPAPAAPAPARKSLR